jgi:hypothetical protein
MLPRATFGADLMLKRPTPPTPAGGPTQAGDDGFWDQGTIPVAALPRDDRSEWRVAFQRDRRGGMNVDTGVCEELAGSAKARAPSKHGVRPPRRQLSARE